MSQQGSIRSHRLMTMVVVLLAGALQVGDAASYSVARSQVSGLTIPLYRKGESSPSVLLRVGRLYKDHRRVGFFRVRLLNVMVCEEAHLEVLRPFSTTDILAELELSLQRLSLEQMMEFRQIKVSFPGDTEPRLEACRAEMAGREIEAGLRLEQVTWRDGKTTGLWDKATLRLRKNPGRLTVTTGRRELDVALWKEVSERPWKTERKGDVE